LAQVFSFHGHPNSFAHANLPTDPTKFGILPSSLLTAATSFTSPTDDVKTTSRILRLTSASIARSPTLSRLSTSSSKTSRASAANRSKREPAARSGEVDPSPEISSTSPLFIRGGGDVASRRSRGARAALRDEAAEAEEEEEEEDAPVVAREASDETGRRDAGVSVRARAERQD
jgi:hypothetical protein